MWGVHSIGQSEAPIESCRRCSSGSESLTVDPSSTRPILGMVPLMARRDSTKLVFPAPA